MTCWLVPNAVVVVVVVVLLHGRWSPATSWVLQETQPAWTEVHWAVLHNPAEPRPRVNQVDS